MISDIVSMRTTSLSSHSDHQLSVVVMAALVYVFGVVVFVVVEYAVEDTFVVVFVVVGCAVEDTFVAVFVVVEYAVEDKFVIIPVVTPTIANNANKTNVMIPTQHFEEKGLETRGLMSSSRESEILSNGEQL